MDKEKIIEMVTGIFRTELNNESIVLTSESNASQVDGWDSLTNLLIINEIESLFKIKFKLRELIGMADVGGLIDSIDSKINHQIET